MRRVLMNRLGLSASVVTLSFATSLVAQTPAKPDNETVSKVAIEAYLANRHAFPYFKCRYTVTVGQARTVEDALAGQLTKAASSEILWIVDGKKVLRQETADPALFKEAEEKAKPDRSGRLIVTVARDSSGYLSDGPRQLRFAPCLRGANIFTPEQPGPGVEETPFDMAIMGDDEIGNPGRLLQDCVAGQRIFQPLGWEEIDGTPVVSMRFCSLAHRPMYQYSFDADHGYLPFRIGFFHPDTGHQLGQVYLTKARPCSKDRWFPERSVSVRFPQRPGALFGARVIKVVELEADKRPEAEDFVLELPAGTSVVNPIDMTSFIRLKQIERVRAEDLGGLAGLVAKAKDTPRMDTAIPHSRTPWLGWAGGLALSLLAVAGAGMLLRHWKRRRAFAS